MSLPNSNSTTYVASSVPAIKAQDLNDLQTWLVYVYLRSSLICGSEYADATLDGTATVSWASKVGSVYFLQQDLAITNLTVTGASTQLETNGYAIFGAGTLTTSGGAIIHANGANASGSTAGAARAFGTLAGAYAGGNGGTTGAGSASANATGWNLGGVGGAGGAGSGGSGGSFGSTNFLPTTYQGSLYYFTPHLMGCVRGLAGYTTASGAYLLQIAAVAGGLGGGGGGGSGGGNGGGGGAGGGVVGVAFRKVQLANASDIQAKGGNGANGVAGNGGGGGAGGGGLVLLYYGSLSISSGSLGAATNTPAGSVGAGVGSGSAGSAGTSGNIISVQLI